jgi:hypothetical protein
MRFRFLLFLAAVIAIAGSSGALTLWQLLAAAAAGLAIVAAAALALWYMLRTDPIESRYASPQDDEDRDDRRRRRGKAKLPARGSGADREESDD